MNNITPEQFIIYALIIAAYLFYQFVRFRIAQKEQPEPIQQAHIQENVKEANEVPSTSSISNVVAGRTEEPVTIARLPQRRFSRRSLMGNTWEKQNAIVIVTVLGPCRAFEPHEIR